MINKLITVVIFGSEFPDIIVPFFAILFVAMILVAIYMALRKRSREKRHSKNVRSRADMKEAMKQGVTLEEQKKKNTKNLLVCPRCGVYGDSSNVCTECGLKI